MYTQFNMNDPVVGGYAPDKVALRRAIALAFDRQAAIDVILGGAGTAADDVVPPGIPGHNEDFNPQTLERDLPKAKALLELFGYADRDGDGFRETPDGRPLVLILDSPAEPRFRAWDELWERNLTSLGIRVAFRKQQQSEMQKAARMGKYQISMQGWNMDFPDGEDFFLILYGGNAGNANGSFFQLPEFDRLYDRARLLPDSPARTFLYR